MGWCTINIDTRETKDQELVRDRVEMRHSGMLDSQTKKGINIVNGDNRWVFVKYGAYSKKIFCTAQDNYHKERVYVANIPRPRQEELACVATKQNEPRNYKNFRVYDEVNSDDAINNIIATEWVPIEKEKHDEAKETKARLCLRGDMEEPLHKFCRNLPTVNKMSLKSLVSIATGQKWVIETCDVERTFLQSD